MEFLFYWKVGDAVDDDEFIWSQPFLVAFNLSRSYLRPIENRDAKTVFAPFVRPANTAANIQTKSIYREPWTHFLRFSRKPKRRTNNTHRGMDARGGDDVNEVACTSWLQTLYMHFACTLSIQNPYVIPTAMQNDCCHCRCCRCSLFTRRLDTNA